MIDIVHPHCKIEGCTTLASFNMPGESRGEFCSQHKQVPWRSFCCIMPRALLRACFMPCSLADVASLMRCCGKSTTESRPGFQLSRQLSGACRRAW